MVLERNLVGEAIMHCLGVILSWSSQQYMSRLYWNHITEHPIIVSSNGETHLNLLSYLYLFIFTKPLKSVWPRTELSIQIQFGH